MSTSAITLINKVPGSTVPMVEFRLAQGTNQIARLGVHAGGKASIPTTTNYQVQATTQIGNFTLTSNTLSFNTTSATLLGQVYTEDGFYDFQLRQLAGSQPSALVCENTWRSPVTFKISQPGSPVQIVTVVNEHNTASVSTAQQWECYAIANGITTEPIIITDPNATITITSNNNDEAFSLTVS